MNFAEPRLVRICDDLLACTGRLRAACEKAGDPWPTHEAKTLIDRLLDIRLQLSAALKKQQPKQPS